MGKASEMGSAADFLFAIHPPDAPHLHTRCQVEFFFP